MSESIAPAETPDSASQDSLITDDMAGSSAPVTEGAPQQYRARILSFSGRSARLKGRQKEAWAELGPKYIIEPPRSIARTSVAHDAELDIAAAFGREGAPTVIEIGSGQGECVANAAASHPETNFLPVEVYSPGIASTLYRLRKGDINNVRIIQADAAEVVGRYFPQGQADELWVFFPDPWHKSRHNKRRLIQPAFTPKAARVLKEGGTWRLATDWLEYAEQMVEVIDASPYFDRVEGQGRFEGRVLTSFERKGLEKGRVITDLTYRRNSVPVSEQDLDVIAHEDDYIRPESLGAPAQD